MRRHAPQRRSACRGAAALLVAALVSLAACSAPPPELPEPWMDPEPDPSEVESVLFLIGDAGEATWATSPVLHVLQRDVETWTAQIDADTAAAVLFLGDIRYPYGLRRRDTDNFPRDTAVIMAQVRVVAGPRARARGVRAYFLPGNHDWGMRSHFEGFERLVRLDGFLDRAAERLGAQVDLVPEPGTGGPYLVDWGEHARLLLLDTAWWLLGGSPVARAEFLEAVDSAMATAGTRAVLFAAHHPFLSAGTHGGQYSLTDIFGLGYLLRRSGAILQSLNSPAYREMTRSFRATFARHGPPFAFIGGHDHSLQVFGHVRETDPWYSIVSGSGSKLSAVGPEPGLMFARSAPGYMRLLIRKDGGMHLTVVAAPREFLLCPEDEGIEGRCMQEGMASFTTVHSQKLR